MAYNWKRLFDRIIKHDQRSGITSSNDGSTDALLLSPSDQQVPRTGLSPNSKWWIVRNNIHKIRSWAPIHRLSVLDQPFVDWYVLFRMKRELKRAAEQIRAQELLPNFTPVRYFDLHIDETRVQRYNVSHVRPSDGIFYSGLDSRPIVLQYLLSYFSRECVVPYNSIFYSFISDVNSVLYTNRERLQRVVVLRRVALTFALVISILLLMMFFSLILSVLTTASNFRQMYNKDHDGGMKWPEDSTMSTSRYRR